MTEWRDIPGHEHRYQVSDQGGVRSLDRLGRDGRRLPGKPVAPTTMPKGYQVVGLTDTAGVVTHMLVHRVVAVAFLGPPPPGQPWVLHGSLGVTFNTPENLRWGTPSDNSYDTVKDGNHTGASKTHCKRGHEFTPANTKPSNVGARVCRECANQRNREYRAREKLRSATPGRP